MGASSHRELKSEPVKAKNRGSALLARVAAGFRILHRLVARRILVVKVRISVGAAERDFTSQLVAMRRRHVVVGGAWRFVVSQ